MVYLKNMAFSKNIYLFLWYFYLTLFSILALLSDGYAENCFAKKPGFGVVHPHLASRVCFLYEHSLHKPAESELKQTLTGDEGLDPDPLIAEYLSLIIHKRYTAIPMGTPFFSCGYDLESLIRDENYARLNGIILPEFQCRGILTPFVPVRLINDSNCWWVPLVAVDCGEIPEEYDFEIRWKREPNVRW
jgi:hypothetical protein